MTHKIQNQISEEISEQGVTSKPTAKRDYLLPASIVIASLIIAIAWVYSTGAKAGSRSEAPTVSGQGGQQVSALEDEVLPSRGVTLPVTWGDLGAKLVSAGVIDADKFKAIYEQRGSFTDEYESLLLGKNNGTLTMTNDNAGYLLNLLWALGLANKNSILETGEMMDPAYGGAERFASTGGWTLSRGNPMDHYSRHAFFPLTPAQQVLVDKVSKGIYRPCCGNSTHFPDCNHGMAMLGLLELMASQGVSEQDIWKTALAVNSYWFPNNYLTIATYMKNKGIDWKDVNAQEVLGANFSSSQGYARVAAQVTTLDGGSQSGTGCAVDAGGAVPQQKQQSGCGI